jgi:2-polyprenyl-6-methoxyphenol hydroxylase-like FAD-dependent oxidoreductase
VDAPVVVVAAGDAGHYRDPLTAQGISDAFRDAQLLSEAIDAGLAGRQPLGGALAGYQDQRDEAAAAMYELTCQRASLEPPTPQMTRLITALHGNQHDTDQFIGVIAGHPGGCRSSPSTCRNAVGGDKLS